MTFVAALPIGRIVRFLALALGLAVAAPAAAAPSPAAPRHIALLVGNWDYNMNSRFDAAAGGDYPSDLPTPCQDTALIGAQLNKFGFEISDFCNIGRDQMASRINTFTEQTKNLPNGSIVFIYYSGHGLQYNGRAFLVPVLFQMNLDRLNAQAERDRLRFMHQNANEVAELVNSLTDNSKVAVILALDNCRDSPFTASDVYNDSVSIRTGANMLVQYATTAGERAPAGGGQSRYAAVLGQELGRGGEIGHVMGRVGIRIWQQFDAGQRDTYAETDIGPAFAAQKYPPLKPVVHPAVLARAAPPLSPAILSGAAASPPPLVTEPAPAVMKAKTYRAIYDGVSLDIFWCEGPGEAERYAVAAAIAKRVAAQAGSFGVGLVRIKPLGEYKNWHQGYNVARNLMRYDIEDPSEKPVLMRIAQAFPEANFLPRRGVGVGDKPTMRYVSAFICGGIEG